MSDIIQLLPDSIANQIAAGEVIQRPASVIKELVENSVDSGATKIEVYIKEAGRTLIQIIDNGSGMSETDARMSFERHATSKIKNIDDLFKIKTLGFRGEALASIAAIAQVELKTKKEDTELGTFISIADSKIEKQELCNCSKGTQIAVKNLFFNVPARRKFLKSNQTEFRHVVVEFQRVALCNPEIEMTLYHNDNEVYNLPTGNLKQRIANIFGKSINNALVSIKTDTIISNIYGFVGKPEYSKKSSSEQYFFVNNRYMRHLFFYKTVMSCYDKLIQADYYPSFFIYIDIDPSKIDINIHPTKTEIKFEDEKALSQIIRASVREALGKFNIVPSIDFELTEQVEIPIFSGNKNVKFPGIEINPSYNPFKSNHGIKYDKSINQPWEKLYESFENKIDSDNSKIDFNEKTSAKDVEKFEVANVFQFKNKYIFCQVKSGLMIIDQKRAYERLIYEKFIKSSMNSVSEIQQTMFPEIIEFSAEDNIVMSELSDTFRKFGFDINQFGKNTYIINGTPSFLEIKEWKTIIEETIEHYKTFETNKDINDTLAVSISKSSAKNFNNKLTSQEMNNLINNLFLCSVQNHTPEGKTIISMLNEQEIEKKF